ncbi:MAG: hypothetical protein M0P61_05870 [Ignavibacteriaceae bacterium]|nr:hypothetical protein [Ignavibacteriaceae bacterium]
MNTEFTKIKIVDDRIHLEWQVRRNDDSFDTFSLDSKDKPAPSFSLKLLDFRSFVNDICDLRLNETELHTLEIRGLSLSYSGDKHIMGTTITALKALPGRNAPLVVNTPHLIEDYYSDNGDPKCLLPQDLVTLIYEIQFEAEHFIKGFRLQLNLFDVRNN